MLVIRLQGLCSQPVFCTLVAMIKLYTVELSKGVKFKSKASQVLKSSVLKNVKDLGKV